MYDFLTSFLKLLVYIGVTGLISNVVGYLVPRDKINVNSFPYACFHWEHCGEVYRCLKVSRWKNKVPDMSKYLSILYPKTLSFHPSALQVERLIQESCIAEFIHIMLIAAGPLINCFIDGFWGDCFTVLYIIGNIPYVIIQRYNRPTLKVLHTQIVERENKQHSSGGNKNESADIVL